MTAPAQAGPSPHVGESDRVLFVDCCSSRRQVAWRSGADLGSAAFWVDQTRRSGLAVSYRMGRTLFEEAAACLLGGHGITGPVTLAAFERVRGLGLLAEGARPEEREYLKALAEPLLVPGSARAVRYRFPRQRAVRLAVLARAVGDAPPGDDGPEVRDWLMTLPGFGPKTASWAARNHTGSENLAVVDVHVQRAGELAGVFCPAWRLPRDYGLFETAFLGWARAGGVRATDLDACIWHQLSALGRRRHVLFADAPTAPCGV